MSVTLSGHSGFHHGILPKSPGNPGLNKQPIGGRRHGHAGRAAVRSVPEQEGKLPSLKLFRALQLAGMLVTGGLAYAAAPVLDQAVHAGALTDAVGVATLVGSAMAFWRKAELDPMLKRAEKCLRTTSEEIAHHPASRLLDALKIHSRKLFVEGEAILVGCKAELFVKGFESMQNHEPVAGAAMLGIATLSHVISHHLPRSLNSE